MTTMASMTPQALWENALEDWARLCDEHYPDEMLPELRKIVDRASERLRGSENPSHEEVDRLITDVGCELPTPLSDIGSMMLGSHRMLADACHVLAAEVLELRARVATLEGAQA